MCPKGWIQKKKSNTSGRSRKWERGLVLVGLDSEWSMVLNCFLPCSTHFRLHESFSGKKLLKISFVI